MELRKRSLGDSVVAGAAPAFVPEPEVEAAVKGLLRPGWRQALRSVSRGPHPSDRVKRLGAPEVTGALVEPRGGATAEMQEAVAKLRSHVALHPAVSGLRGADFELVEKHLGPGAEMIDFDLPMNGPWRAKLGLGRKEPDSKFFELRVAARGGRCIVKTLAKDFPTRHVIVTNDVGTTNEAAMEVISYLHIRSGCSKELLHALAQSRLGTIGRTVAHAIFSEEDAANDDASCARIWDAKIEKINTASKNQNFKEKLYGGDLAVVVLDLVPAMLRVRNAWRTNAAPPKPVVTSTDLPRHLRPPDLDDRLYNAEIAALVGRLRSLHVDYDLRERLNLGMEVWELCCCATMGASRVAAAHGLSALALDAYDYSDYQNVTRIPEHGAQDLRDQNVTFVHANLVGWNYKLHALNRGFPLGIIITEPCFTDSVSGGSLHRTNEHPGGRPENALSRQQHFVSRETTTSDALRVAVLEIVEFVKHYSPCTRFFFESPSERYYSHHHFANSIFKNVPIEYGGRFFVFKLSYASYFSRLDMSFQEASRRAQARSSGAPQFVAPAGYLHDAAVDNVNKFEFIICDVPLSCFTPALLPSRCGGVRLALADHGRVYEWTARLPVRLSADFIRATLRSWLLELGQDPISDWTAWALTSSHAPT